MLAFHSENLSSKSHHWSESSFRNGALQLTRYSVKLDELDGNDKIFWHTLTHSKFFKSKLFFWKALRELQKFHLLVALNLFATLRKHWQDERISCFGLTKKYWEFFNYEIADETNWWDKYPKSFSLQTSSIEILQFLHGGWGNCISIT